MRLTRRSMVFGTASLMAALGLPGRPPRRARAAEPQPLRIPPLIDAAAQGNAVDLRVQAGRTEFFPGHHSDTLGYNGDVLGPTLRLRRGDDVRIAVANDWQHDTAVHWHGLLVPAVEAGGPHQPIRPGETWQPTLAVRQPAATLLYHALLHGATAEQVYAGLAGMIVIADDEEQALGLPGEYGVDDLPLLIQDRQFEDGLLVLPGGTGAVMHGRRGDTILVNGTPDAVARIPAGLVRLRLVNGANARIFPLSFHDGRTFHWIAGDGGLLEAPVPLRALQLAPGQRAEILVDFADGRPATLQTEPDPNLPAIQGTAPGAAPEGPFPAVLRFEPQGGGGAAAAIPERLAARERIDPARAARRRRFVLNMGMIGGAGGMIGTGGMPAPGGIIGAPGMPALGQGGMVPAHGINGRPFALERIDERVPLGEVEIWEVAGEMFAHPFHVQGVQFEVLRRGGAPAEARDQGLRDTVLVREPTELLVHFGQPAPQKPFLYYCRILEHVDNGMAGQFLTV